LRNVNLQSQTLAPPTPDGAFVWAETDAREGMGGGTNDIYAGLSRLMLVQRNFSTRDNQISQPDAAAQHGFPKAAIEFIQVGRNPNRPYAAPVTDVSHADKT